MNKIVPYNPNRPRSPPYYPPSNQSVPNDLRIVRSRDERGYETFEIDIGEYDQRDISVQVHSDNHLVVHAVHYYNYLDKFNYVRRELLRTFQLPPNADQEYISSNLSPNGILTVHVPIRRPVPPYEPQPMDAMREHIDRNNFSNQVSSSVVDIVEPRSTRRSSMLNRFMPNFKQQDRCRASSGSRMLNSRRNRMSVHDFLDSPLKPEYSKRNHSLIVRLDLRGYKAQDIAIKVDDYLMTVSAQCRSDEDNRRYESRKKIQTYEKQFRLPDETDIRKIKSELNARGVLVIEIPLQNF
ncbi:hypothetical protein ACOME3_001696 [Neoechinorhynchus agilis]